MNKKESKFHKEFMGNLLMSLSTGAIGGVITGMMMANKCQQRFLWLVAVIALILECFGYSLLRKSALEDE